ncbi:transcriptional regulator, LacI family [Paenibacillus curdlanolyticus YK9]|uniref:Transcriptional regulator, LacI family n=1 Tax=Paenibacillus curdlanolyticus YK9 TaxID=717606 RepID=E0I7R3_9BACL|nr:LacI family DNA-binding transcriptional regulator [Paenibacillus curdlanolyticus]EFM11218.1 transcriptional regulator, LacI family [Paenibacillus curdlanolyticus YK9]
MSKKPTLRDVAKEAGVSVATASYVLNKVTNQTIPEETRKRVYDAVEKLSYIQNLTARALSVGKTNLLGILLIGKDSDLITKHISYAKFIDQLERLSLERQYRLLVARIDPAQPNFDLVLERKLDGVFVIDASANSFHEIASKFTFGTPIVLVDGLIDDPLFRHVVHDYKQLFDIVNDICDGQPYSIVHECYHNQALNNWLQQESRLPADRIWPAASDVQSLRSFASSHHGQPLLVLNEFLALQLASFVNPADMIVVCTSDCPEYVPRGARSIRLQQNKAEQAYEMMKAILNDPFATEQSVLLPFHYESSI